MGETTDGGLYEIFQQDFGPVGSTSFEAARENFIISSAGYAVASLLLQPKDRHNGNLLFDKYEAFLSLSLSPTQFIKLDLWILMAVLVIYNCFTSLSINRYIWKII